MEDNDRHHERIEYKSKRRKEEIKNILIGKRLQPDHQKVQRSITDFIVREEKIRVEEKEDLGVKGYPKHPNTTKKGRKRIKRGAGFVNPHIISKDYAPIFECFHCGKLRQLILFFKE